MNQHANVNQFSKNMLKVAACLALGAVAAPTVFAAPEPLPIAVQNGTITGTVLDENGERIPITIHDYNREKGTVTIIFQIVGATTERLSHLSAGDCLQDFVGPLGRATETAGKKRVAVVVGGVGCAIGYPVAKKFHDLGTAVHTVAGFRTKDLVILEDEEGRETTLSVEDAWLLEQGLDEGDRWPEETRI